MRGQPVPSGLAATYASAELLLPLVLLEIALWPCPNPLALSFPSVCLLPELLRRRGEGARGGGTARGEDQRRPLG